MDEKVAKAMYGDLADQGAPRKKKEAYCSWCFEYAIHFYIKETTSWVCDACKGRTLDSQKFTDWMARLEGSAKRNPICAKSQPNFEGLLDKKRMVLSKPRGAAKVRFEMTRESPFRHMAQKEGLVRPFLFLVSMSPHHRALLSIQLGWCPFEQDYFGDSHEESWQVLTFNRRGDGAFVHDLAR
jgi:hypothetical protein